MSSKNQLTVSGHFENLARISHFIGQAGLQAGLDDRAVYAIQMAVDEACCNIIEHGYGGQGRGSIHLACNIRKDGLQVIIQDQGKSFDLSEFPELDTEAPLTERRSRGMGVFFIHSLVDSVEFQSGTPQGNRLTLFKRREQTL